MKKLIFALLKTALVLYVVGCGFLYLAQEKLIFFPQKLSPAYKFSFNQPFEEIKISATDHTVLSGLLFKAEHPKGVILYLHGNAGSLATWGHIASTYTALDYDVFMLDYRGYGKSEGVISNQTQIFQDIQSTYDFIKQRYNENKIIVLGGSCKNKIKTLIFLICA